MNTSFRFVALPRETFSSLFAQSDAALAEKGICRQIADVKPGTPCRISLADAEPGERVLLLSFTHQPAASPYHSAGPIFVREGALQARPAIGEVPEVVRSRLMSVRAYDSADMMIHAEVTEGHLLEAPIERFFADSRVSYLHLHNAKPGCFACRVDRA